MSLLPLDRLGARAIGGEAVAFGALLPWISPAGGYRVGVEVACAGGGDGATASWRNFELTHGDDDGHGDLWSGHVPLGFLGRTADGSGQGAAVDYLYRLRVQGPDGRTAAGLLDPFARESGRGATSRLTISRGRGYRWSEHEASWRTPPLEELVIYELLVPTFGGDLDGTRRRLDHVAGLGVTAIELLPVVQSARPADYLPLSHFAIDGRFGRVDDLKRLVDAAHQRGMAVILDVICSHTGAEFPYLAAYRELGFADNPMMGAFARGDFGPSLDFRKRFTRDYFLTANAAWLDECHVDGFRYDFVPGCWDGPTGDGFASLAYRTHQLVERKTAAGGHWRRFGGGPAHRLIQCAEDLERPEQVLATSYANCAWQPRTLDAARRVARGDRGQIADLGLRLGAWGFPAVARHNGVEMPKAVVHYLESHDHDRFLTALLGEPGPRPDRSRAHRVRPYLVSLFMAKGLPMLWQGQELCSWEPTPGLAERQSTPLHPLDWSLTDQEPAAELCELVRRLARLRRRRPEIRAGEHYFHSHPDRLESRGLLVFSRFDAAAFSLVAVNFSGVDRRFHFRFDRPGDYRQRLGVGADQLQVGRGERRCLEVPADDGRVWCLDTSRR